MLEADGVVQMKQATARLHGFVRGLVREISHAGSKGCQLWGPVQVLPGVEELVAVGHDVAQLDSVAAQLFALQLFVVLQPVVAPGLSALQIFVALQLDFVFRLLVAHELVVQRAY